MDIPTGSRTRFKEKSDAMAMEERCAPLADTVSMQARMGFKGGRRAFRGFEYSMSTSADGPFSEWVDVPSKLSCNGKKINGKQASRVPRGLVATTQVRDAVYGGGALLAPPLFVRGRSKDPNPSPVT